MKRIALLCSVSALAGALLSQSWSPAGGSSWLNSSQTQAAQPDSPITEVRPQPSASVLSPAESAIQARTTEETANIRVYQHANHSVVNINTRSIEVDHFFRTQRQLQGSGSGIVLDREGHILTNAHVVEDARTIEVTLASNESFQATLVGQDEESDIAVLRIEAPKDLLFPITLGSSESLQVGQRAYAVGNPFGWGGTLTTGIISSLNRNLPSRVAGREMESLIQTDAAMNPGNSGGPLLDTGARMIGMCVAIASRTGQNSGVGFAIPIDRIKRIVPELIKNGRVLRANIGITHVMETSSGLVVARTTPDGPAERAGLQGFRIVVERRRQGALLYESESIDRSHADRILAVDGDQVKTGVQFRDKIWEYRPGDIIRLTVLRDGKKIEVPVTLDAT